MTNEKYAEFCKNIGKNIKKQREIANLTQEELAERAQISLDYLGKIEVNINNPGLKTIFKLARALKIEACKFFK